MAPVGKHLHDMADRIEELEAENERLHAYIETFEGLSKENERLRRGLDNVKVRAYELGQIELHDMALEALKGDSDD
jgi:predicted RNase H-like nuclease (RuvC/YqgF family)